MKFSDAQKIPERTFVSSFHVPSTLKNERKCYKHIEKTDKARPMSWMVVLVFRDEILYKKNINTENIFLLWCPAATRGPYSLCHRVLEPHPELSSRGGRLEGLPPLHGPPVALREGDVQLSHWELGDDLAQRLWKKPVVGHWETNITQLRLIVSKLIVYWCGCEWTKGKTGIYQNH